AAIQRAKDAFALQVAAVILRGFRMVPDSAVAELKDAALQLSCELVDRRESDFKKIGQDRMRDMQRPLEPDSRSSAEVISPEQLRARLEVVFDAEGGFQVKG